MKQLLEASGLLILAACLGCEASAPSTSGQQSASFAPAPPEPAAPAENAAPKQAEPPAGAAAGQPPVVANAQAAVPAAAAPAAGATPAAAATTDNAPATADDGSTLKKAEVGVGIKGKDYEPGFVTTPVAAKFRIEDRIAFEAQIPNGMKLYKAAHDNKGPATHEEFMKVIIKDQGVQLPVLAEGESYLYDPKTEELMVKSPKP